jgi:glycosyltransferase involved in cell wall biosynthesis
MSPDRGNAPGNADRPGVVILGPTPPPHHGMSIYTWQILHSRMLAERFEVLHVETADRRSLDNMGRLDVQNVLLALLHGYRLARTIVRHRPRLVYVLISQNALAYLRDSLFIVIARLLRCRVATHLHGSEFGDFHRRSGPVMRALIRWTSRRLAAVAVLSPSLRPIYAGLVAEDRVHVVPNGIVDPFPRALATAAPAAAMRAGAPVAVGRDTGLVSVAADSEAVPGVVTVLYLGTLYEPKGILELLYAAARLRDSAPHIRFILAGPWFSDSQRRTALALVEQERLDATVVFPGVVLDDEKWALLQQADLLVFPGWQAEGLPLVILEAMAAGRAVIATDTGAVADAVVDGETGVIVGKRSPAALAAAILELAGDPAARQRMGRAGRLRYEAAFTADRAEERLAVFLTAACGLEPAS